MSKRLKLTISIMLNLIVVCYAQIDNKIENYSPEVTAPDVSSFERYSYYPVNLSSGRLDISIPIITINSGDISYPISVNYNAGGIKVDDVASSVGLGWNISQTIISRHINGYNDLNDYGNRSVEEAGGFDLFLEEDLSDELGFDRIGFFKQSSENIKLGGDKTNVDFYPDVYNLYSPTFQTKFYFNEDKKTI